MAVLFIAAAGTTSHLLFGFSGMSDFCIYIIVKKSALNKMSCADCLTTTRLCGNSLKMYDVIMHCWMEVRNGEG